MGGIGGGIKGRGWITGLVTRGMDLKKELTREWGRGEGSRGLILCCY